MAVQSRRKFLKTAAVAGALVGGIGGFSIGKLALRGAESVKASLRARKARRAFFEKHSGKPEEWMQLAIPAEALPRLEKSISSSTLARVEAKAAGLEMRENGVVRVLETIRFNAGDKAELNAWKNAAAAGNARAKRVLNIVEWFGKLDEKTREEIQALADFVPLRHEF